MANCRLKVLNGCCCCGCFASDLSWGSLLRFAARFRRIITGTSRHKVCVCVCVIIWLPSLADYQLRLAAAAAAASSSPLTIISMPTNFEHPFECCKHRQKGFSPWWTSFVVVVVVHLSSSSSSPFHPHHTESSGLLGLNHWCWLEHTIQIAPGNVGDDTEKKER